MYLVYVCMHIYAHSRTICRVSVDTIRFKPAKLPSGNISLGVDGEGGMHA